MIYNLNGIPTEIPPDGQFWIAETNFDFIFSVGDLTSELDFTCVGLHQLFIKKLFATTQEFYDIMPRLYPFLMDAGLDSESALSKEDFEIITTKHKKDELLNRLFYLYDCRNLISSLQSAISESKHLFGQFYKILNTQSFRVSDYSINPNGLQYASGYIVSNIFSIITALFVNLYSQLDFITKIVFEYEHCQTKFDSYPRLKSAGILFGSKNKLSIVGLKGSVFDNNVTTQTIISLRNELVHNASLDVNPKVYQRMEDNKTVEKYILLPDMEKGNIVTFRNRKRFFARENKLNQLLPNLTTDFWKRMHVTLQALQE